MKIKVALTAFALAVAALAFLGAGSTMAGDVKSPRYKVISFRGAFGGAGDTPKIEEILNKMDADGYEIRAVADTVGFVVFERRP